MSKPFLTYDQQLDKLQNEKKLQIHDRAAAKEILKNIGYFSLIGGYKGIVVNPPSCHLIDSLNLARDCHRHFPTG